MEARTENGKRVGLGRKGTETRARLLAATRELLTTTSPFHLTVAAIAKAAGSSPATLYVYFDDVQDALFALATEASDAFGELYGDHPEWFSRADQLEQDCAAFIGTYNRVWDTHCHELRYRNLEAERGNSRFLELQTANAVPIIERLARAIRHFSPALRSSDAHAEAVVLYCTMERLAGVRSQFPSGRPGPATSELDRAQVRVLARHLKPD